MSDFISLLISLLASFGMNTSPPAPEATQSFTPSASAFIRTDNLHEVAQTYARSCARYESLRDPARMGLDGEARMTPKQFDWYLASCAQLETLLSRQATQADYLRWLDRNFQLEPVVAEASRPMLTAYYEPTIPVSEKATASLNWPIYAQPENGTSATRQSIESGKVKGLKPLYYTDRWSAFVLQVQGSGTGRMSDGKEVRFVFAGTNELPYTSIGKVLIDQGEISKEEISMQAIGAWMKSHDKKAQDQVYWKNQRMIFFALKEDDPNRVGPPGAMSLAEGLTPYRSAAMDWKHFIPGLPVLVSGELGQQQQIHRLVIAQDRGAAIKSSVRMDLFLGSGETAEQLAGLTQDDQARFWRLTLHPQGHRG
ncbi:MltA domain-containing protein [Pokkaliibacter sp. CJK22405]|uniref:MltA domain-containing protein n=1 Tax=Pokkaliibacter sp. CJK22405 TaxID=3384615 RepID=UPI003984D0D1